MDSNISMTKVGGINIDLCILYRSLLMTILEMTSHVVTHDQLYCAVRESIISKRV